MAYDFSVLTDNLAALKTDAEALIGLVGQTDPTVQQKINDAAQAVAAIDAEVKAALPA